MAAAFTTWTVLPHQPIEKLADNLWRVAGKMADGKTQRQMVVARLADGRLLVYNAIALDEPEMAELERWGTPAVLVVPNGFHRQDAAIWKQRYPGLQVVAPPGSRKRVAKVVAVDAVTTDAPGDDTVRLRPVDGMPMEAVLEVRSGDDVTLVYCDAIMNMPKLPFPMSVLLGPTGRVSAPRVMRWVALKDKAAFARQLDAQAALPGLRRVLVGHGAPITDDPAGTLRQVAAQLRG